MHRPTVGIIALVLLAGIAVFGFWQPLEAAQNDACLSGCIRVGVVMSALWLALPLLEAIPNWLIKAGLMLVLVLAAISGKPRVLLIAGGAYAIVVLVRPIIEAIKRAGGAET